MKTLKIFNQIALLSLTGITCAYAKFNPTLTPSGGEFYGAPEQFMAATVAFFLDNLLPSLLAIAVVIGLLMYAFDIQSRGTNKVLKVIIILLFVANGGQYLWDLGMV
jgi:hypothetical protein